MGHSNGSAFTSLLLNQRGNTIAATATLSAQPGPALLATDPVRSMFMGMGEADPLVPFEQQQRSIPLVEAKLSIDPTTATTDGYLRSAYGPNNIELDTYVHPGGHDVPAEVPPLVVAFFQRHTRPAA
jgi:polyhydroxybutyrate depolymerase